MLSTHKKFLSFFLYVWHQKAEFDDSNHSCGSGKERVIELTSICISPAFGDFVSTQD
jgi:hypothetical protein